MWTTCKVIHIWKDLTIEVYSLSCDLIYAALFNTVSVAFINLYEINNMKQKMKTNTLHPL